MKRSRFDSYVRRSLCCFLNFRHCAVPLNKNICCFVAGLFLLMFGMIGQTSAQQKLVTDAQKKRLGDLTIQLNARRNTGYQRALALAKTHGWAITKRLKGGALMSLQGVDSLGYPVYAVTYENIIAAATTNTNALQPGGALRLGLSGSTPTLANKLAIWDEGSVYAAHQEFAGKAITLNSPAIAPSDHATHVAGTMVAKGVYAPVKGMAFGAATLQSYDYNNDLPSISSAAGGLLLSNHSYGTQAGWVLDLATGHWEWYGLPGDSVDYKFGFYSQKTQAYDAIAYNAPYYFIVEAAGNIHSSNGPAVGADYYGFNSAADQTIVDKGPRPANISSDAGYDVISETGNAKNILTIGAVNPLPNGPANSAGIVVGSFSSWGPTDDGRVKPDIMGDGVNVQSTGSSSPTSYITLSGTSMAAPNITGSLYLLQEYYAQLNGGKFMRAATLKGLACHTAFDAGTPGPDYIYGWGLLNSKFAAQTLATNGDKSLVQEHTLNQGATQTIKVVASGNGPLSATISWTDPAGSATADGTINDRSPKLVNDLDIRVSDGANTFYPWVLNPATPSAGATKGDNLLDNVEQVFIPAPQVGLTYTITVSHKGALQSGAQDYSLIVTGIGNNTYCASAPLSDADSRVDNVTLANINNTPPSGCTTYSNYTNLTAYLWQGKSYPLSLTLGTCGENFSKAANVYIDWNANGTFEPGELVATSNIISTTGVYQTNITVPASVVPGTKALMRVVLNETNDPSTIQACGNYAKGETQDYTVQFSIDSSLYPHAATGAISGSISACAGTASVSPAIQQFTLSGSFLKDSLVATAPTGFEVSLAAVSGYGAAVSIAQTGGNVNNVTIYVRSSSTAPAGNISGSVVLTSAGMPPQAITVTGQVNELPVVNTVPNQGPYANGSTTQAINFTGTGLKYNWVNDTPGIGLAASGTGTIPSFTAVNTGSKPVTATITVTPVPAPGLAYVPNSGSNDVSVINTLTDQVIAQIPGGHGPQGISVSPNGSRVYVTDFNSGDVLVIDASANRVIDTIPVGPGPFGIVVSPDNSRAYVCDGHNVSVINTATNAVIDNIYVTPDAAYAIAASPDGSRVYVTDQDNDTARVINTATNTVIASIKVGYAAFGVVVNTAGTLVYVANTADNTISVIDAKTNTVTATIPVPNGPMEMCFSPDGKQLYVTNSGDFVPTGVPPGAVTVISTATNKITGTIPVGQYPIGVFASADGSKVYVINDFGTSSLEQGTISVISTATMSVVNTINVGQFPNGWGNFLSQGSSCTGIPITFTITVDPTAIITASKPAGSIASCYGTASTTPNIQQFMVSATSLVQDLTVTAPPGFEVSLNANTGYGYSVAITPTSGTVAGTTVYVRISADALTGSATGNVTLASQGAVTQNVAVSGTVGTSFKPAVSISTPSANVCAGSLVAFTATATDAGNALVYQWQLNGVNVGTNTASFSSTTFATGDVITCTVTSNSACSVPPLAVSNSITINVASVTASPSVSISSSADPVCQGSPVTFTAIPANAGSAPAYQWLVNGKDAGTNSHLFTSTALNSGDIISCVMTASLGCTLAVASNSITETVTPLPVVSAGEKQTIAPGGQVQLNGSVSGGTGFSWSPATGLSDPTSLTPMASPAITTTYTLTALSASGCTSTGTVTIAVRPGTLFIPNTFTPNGDGVNDTWVISGLDLYTACIVRIYNRWGQELYYSTGYGNPWDGTYNNKQLPAGTYYYLIDLKDGSKLLSGFVAMIR